MYTAVPAAAMRDPMIQTTNVKPMLPHELRITLGVAYILDERVSSSTRGFSEDMAYPVPTIRLKMRKTALTRPVDSEWVSGLGITKI